MKYESISRMRVRIVLGIRDPLKESHRLRNRLQTAWAESNPSRAVAKEIIEFLLERGQRSLKAPELTGLRGREAAGEHSMIQSYC